MLKQEEIQQLFGRVIRKERKKQNYTQSTLAEKANLDNTYISQIERGITNPTLFTLHKIAWSLNLTEFEIFQKIKEEIKKNGKLDFDSETELETVYNAIGNLNASLILTANHTDDYRIIYCNKAFQKLSNKSRDQLVGKKLQDILSDGNNNPVLKRFLSDLEFPSAKQKLITNHDGFGSAKELEIDVSSVLHNWDNQDKVDKHLFTVRYKERLAEGILNGRKYPAIEKYKTLLKETHHRVKNNLSIIVGIIDISLLDTQDERIKSILKDTQLRISSIANMHELLLAPTDEDKIAVHDYIDKLTMVIESTYSFKEKVKLNKSLDAIDVDIHKGVSLGLLCNELITNSYKYAFPDTTDNVIHLEIKTIGSDKIHFSYYDNGVGFKRETIENAESLGFSLINTFLEELKAKKLHIETQDCFKLEFEMENEPEAA